MTEFVLEMKNITKRFPGVLALQEVNFNVIKGEIIGLVGENGAGTSTLMKILSGAYPHRSYEGEILVDGEEKKFSSPLDSEKASIAMIYQEISMHLDMSVAENLFLGRWKQKSAGIVNWREMNKAAREQLGKVNLDIDPALPLRRLSSSQMQLISIARALSKKPRLLVLDEPTSALAKSESLNLFGILEKLRDQGISSILISHKLDEVFENCNRITVLRDGRVISTTEREDIVPENIISAMIGKKIDNYYSKKRVAIGDVVMKVENLSVPHPYDKDRLILDGIDFELHRGEILGLAGLVGSGRSELVNALFGKIPKRAGTIVLNGKEVDIRTPIDAVKNGVGLVTEDRKQDGIVDILSIKENMTLTVLDAISRYTVILSSLETKLSMKYFEHLNIKAESINTPMYTLSGGNQQKVVLGKWLGTKPHILFLDEPTRGVDIGSKHEIYKIMTQLVEEGISIIMISTELPELISMSDRVMVISNAGIKAVFDSADCTHDQLAQAITLATDNAPEERGGMLS
jgi:ABC-type sugar transport system ATPase subunit